MYPPVTMQAGMLGAFASHQRARGLSEQTIKRRESSLRKFGDPTRVTLLELEDVLARARAPESKKAIVGDLRRFVVWCQSHDVDVSDPLERFDRVKVPQRMPTPVSREELERILEVAYGPTRVAVMLMAYAGLRVSEVAALDHRDIRRDLGVLFVRNGKGDRDDVIPLAPALAAVLPPGRRGPVFPCCPLGRHVSGRIQRAMRRAGVGGRPHDLRSTFGTEVARASGGNTFLTQKLMRHTNLSSTQRYVLTSASGDGVIERLYA